MATIKEIKQGDLTWVNIDRVDEESLKYLKDNYNFHHLDLEDLQSESQTPKIDVYKNYLFLVLQFPTWNVASQTILPFEVDFFIGNNFLITIQHTKSKEMKNFFYRCMKNRRVKKDWMSQNSGYLVFRIIESLFQNSRPILNNIGRKISQIENTIFDGQVDTSLVQQLALYRRNVLGFRRIIDPQRFLISNLSHTRKPYLNEKQSHYYDDVNDYLNKLWAIIDTYKDTIQGLHVTLESLINQKTNKVIGALTAISVSLLPLTLLSGIYGMNISGLPFSDSPKLVWAMFAGLGSVILIFVVMGRKKGWL